MNSVQVANNSGFRPVGKAVLLRALELLEESSRLVVPDSVKMSAATADTMGIVVDIGPDAWKGDTPRAKIGDHVLITRYTGGMLRGTDGFVYRMIPCDAIYAVKEEANG